MYFHWCPACLELHPLPDVGWTFDGNLEQPTFTPSFKHSGKRHVLVDGEWSGEYVRDAAGNALDDVCHYVLTAGILNFAADCTHAMAGQSVPLPALPAEL